MGKYKEFSINIDDGKDTYFAGETIEGNVRLHLNSPMSMLRLIVNLEGKARCTNGATLTEQFLNRHSTVFGCPPERDFHFNSEHPGGIRIYPFTFQLPDELPSSVQASNGEIRYKITARIVFKGLKGLISKDWRVAKNLNIKQIIDGNKEENKMPIKQVIRRKSGLFTKQSNLQKEDLLITMEHSLYCPGEDIVIHIRYADVNARKMAAIKSRVTKYILFNPKENKRRYATRKVVQEVNDLKSVNDRIYQRILTIPLPENITPTNVLTRCIKLNYTVHLKVDGYPELKIPLCVGTRKLRTQTENEEEELRAIQLAMERSNHDQISLPTVGNDSPFVEISNPTSDVPPSVIPSPSAPPYNDTEWNPTMYMFPPEYSPENEFDLPPSYNEAIASSS